MNKLILLIALCLTAFSAQARDKSIKTHQDFSLPCPAEDPACAELHILPRSITSFEKLKLERVIDGDTFVASGRKIRLWGINAPEKNAPAFLASTWLLQGLIKDGPLTCKLIERDRYQREVMHCLIDGLDVGAMMVKMGMAKDHPKYSGGYYQLEQNEAKAENRGIWKLDTLK